MKKATSHAQARTHEAPKEMNLMRAYIYTRRRYKITEIPHTRTRALSAQFKISISTMNGAHACVRPYLPLLRM